MLEVGVGRGGVKFGPYRLASLRGRHTNSTCTAACGPAKSGFIVLEIFYAPSLSAARSCFVPGPHRHRARWLPQHPAASAERAAAGAAGGRADAAPELPAAGTDRPLGLRRLPPAG